MQNYAGYNNGQIKAALSSILTRWDKTFPQKNLLLKMPAKSAIKRTAQGRGPGYKRQAKFYVQGKGSGQTSHVPARAKLSKLDALKENRQELVSERKLPPCQSKIYLTTLIAML